MVDLTGYWLADDGCQYYLSQEGNQLCWAGLDNHGWLHDGLQVANVFFGSIVLTGRIAPVQVLEGEWVDVPRGPSMSSGHLRLEALTDTEGETIITRVFASGGFRASQWRRSSREAGNVDQRFWFDKPIHEVSASLLFKFVVKNSTNTLENDLDVYRDVVVAYGRLRYDDPGKVFVYPFVQQLPEWGTSLSDFFENNDVDRDACFDIAPDLGAWDHHLSHSNVPWVDGRDPNVISGKFAYGQEHGGVPQLHCEMVMYAPALQQGDTPLPAYLLTSYEGQGPFPGWEAQAGDSILINGKPVNGNIGSGESVTDKSVERTITSIGDLKLPPDGSYVRVTGVLVLDCGHAHVDSNGVYDLRPCFDEADDDFDMAQENQEIHPVFSIDVINATPSTDFSGAWGADNGDTIYLHQVGQTVMGLRLPALGTGNAVTVLTGVRRNGELRGEWRQVSPPVSGGELLLQGGELALEAVAPDDGVWRKLYDATDQTPSIAIAEIDYQLCDERRPLQGREGGTIGFTVLIPSLLEGSQFTYQWEVNGMAPAGSGLQDKSVTLRNLPAAGTVLTVSVTVTDDIKNQYTASREFVVLSPLPAGENVWLEFWCLLAKLGRIPLPVPVPVPNLPDPPPLEIMEQINDLRAPWLAEIRGLLRTADNLVRQLTGEPQASEGAPKVHTAVSISDVSFHTDVTQEGQVNLSVDFQVHNTGLSHVVGLVYTTDFWATSGVAPAVFQGKGDGFEFWHAEVSAPDAQVTFEFVIFCDDYGGDNEVPRIWDTNGGRRYQAIT